MPQSNLVQIFRLASTGSTNGILLSLVGNTKDLLYVLKRERGMILLTYLPWLRYCPSFSQGTATIPPCYGKDTRGTKRGANHWRVMKDPIRIQKKQLLELERLIRERIAPIDDPIMPCQPDTAAKVSQDGRVDVARPLQYYDEEAHDVTFCECKDWESKWPEDQAWCQATKDVEERLYVTPYNFESDGF